MTIPRLFVPNDLSDGARFDLSADQAHYLVNVLRLSPGGRVRAFNGRDGEWDAEIMEAGKRRVFVALTEQRRVQARGVDVDLIFAPLKKARTDFVVEKATELGVARLRPVFTHRTNAGRVNAARLGALAIEAAEQTERLDAPEVMAAVPLERLLADWPTRDAGRRLIFCDEGAPRDTIWSKPGAGAPGLVDCLAAHAPGRPWGILIGPEGGFAPEERARLAACPFADAVNLGPRILRADTAAVVALTVFQAHLGDWRGDYGA